MENIAAKVEKMTVSLNNYVSRIPVAPTDF